MQTCQNNTLPRGDWEGQGPGTAPKGVLPLPIDEKPTPEGGAGTDTGKGKEKDPATPEPEPTYTCQENHDEEVHQCETATLRAQSACDEDNSLGSSLGNIATTAALAAGQKTAVSIQESCNKMGGYMRAANAALAAYRQLCSSSVSACLDVCDVPLTQKCTGSVAAATVSNARSAMTGNARSCQGFSSKLGQANQAMQNYAAIQSNAESCAILSGSPTTEFCRKNPTYPGCGETEKQDCTNPKIATSKVCVCAKNPTHPSCGAGIESKNAAASVSTFDTTTKPSADLDSGSSPSTTDVRGPASLGKAQPMESVDGRQGNSASLNVAVHGPGLEKRLKQKSTQTPSVLGGYFQGASSAMGKMYDKLTLKDSSANSRSPSSINSSNPDLSKFLPGSYNPHMAGSAGRADGVTGPHSDIWKKIQNRYESVRGSLLP